MNEVPEIMAESGPPETFKHIYRRVLKVIRPDLGGSVEDLERLDTAYKKALAGDPDALLAMQEYFCGPEPMPKDLKNPNNPINNYAQEEDRSGRNIDLRI